MRLLLLQVFFVIFTLTIEAAPQWTFYPLEKGNDNVADFRFSVHQIEMDSTGIIYCRARAADEIDIYNPADNSWKKVDVKLPVGIATDQKNNLWIASNGDGLIRYNGSDTTSLTNLLLPFFSGWQYNYPLAAGITIDKNGYAWLGYGPYLFCIGDTIIKHYNLQEMGISKMFFEEEILFKDGKLVFAGQNGYSLIMVDPEKPAEAVQIMTADTSLMEDDPSIKEIKIHDGDIYCLIAYEWGMNPYPVRNIFKLNGDKFDTLTLDYLPDFPQYSIQDFTFDGQGDLVVFASIYDGTAWRGELVFYRNGKKQSVYPAPEVDVQGKKNFSLTHCLFFDKKNFWMSNYSLGVLRFSLDATGIIDSEQHNEFTALPNPANDYITLEGLVPEDKPELFTSLGCPVAVKCTDGRMDLSNLAPGIYFIKAGNIMKKVVKL